MLEEAGDGGNDEDPVLNAKQTRRFETFLLLTTLLIIKPGVGTELSLPTDPQEFATLDMSAYKSVSEKAAQILAQESAHPKQHHKQSKGQKAMPPASNAS